MTKKIKEEKKEEQLFNKQLNVLETQFGDNVLETLASVKSRPVSGISSGSLSIDYILSPKLGGMRKGMLLQLWGMPSTGKTTLALGFAANATARKERVIFVDAEKTFDPDVAIAAGVDGEYFHLLRREAEESANILYQMLKTGEIGLVIIDSIAAWKPHPKAKADKDIDITHDRIAAASSFISTTLPRIADICADNNVLLIVINQVRNNLGQYMGGLKPFGGWTLEHYIAASIRMTGKVQQTSNRIVDPVTQKPIGQYVTCVCDKSKISIPLKSVKIPLILGIGVHPHMELAELAIQTTGIITGGGGRYRWADDPEAGQLAHGLSNLLNKLYNEPEFFKEVRDRVIEKLELKYPDGTRNPFLDVDGSPKKVEFNSSNE